MGETDGAVFSYSLFKTPGLRGEAMGPIKHKVRHGDGKRAFLPREHPAVLWLPAGWPSGKHREIAPLASPHWNPTQGLQ